MFGRLKVAAGAVPVVAQWAGLGMAAGGLYLLAGAAWTLLAGGLVVTGLGALKEAGKL